MPHTAKQVQEELKKHGITTMDQLAEQLAKQSAAKAEWNNVRGLPEGEDLDYWWTGKNYSIYHPEQ